ncbi:diacylglyceryl transferase [Eikenella sp. S3360]|uniref:Diacylglyceryl transferase n=1 Tax=Eikenella glucosivorans TaxID=2766967 RepID=A0ABS0N9E6_9NEIS|nr:diacylglyceryl transferase [Eikenella glucosivorans]MBH5328928.1 diacylglyceryl transferase [Eikenella glucosivorans]
MLMAFVLGFWCIWMGEREPSVALEGLFFTIMAIVANSFMHWTMPEPDTVWALQWGLVWAWAILMMFLVDKFGENGLIRLVIALAAGGGYFWLERNGCGLAAGWLGTEAECVKSVANAAQFR